MQRAEPAQLRAVRWPALAGSRAWLLPVAVWLLVVAWRPAVLGFYHDDWVSLMPLSGVAAIKSIAEQASRPVYGVMMTFARFALPPSPVGYQGLLALLIAAAAMALARLGSRVAVLAGASAAAAPWAGAFAATTWIATPWCLGISLWPTTFPAQVSVIAFCAMALAILDDTPLRKKAVRSLTIFFLSSLISEAFWLSFFPLLLMLLGTGRRWLDRERIREVVVLSIGFVAIQAALALQNRLWVLLGIGVNRGFNEAWLQTAQVSLSLIQPEFGKAVMYPEAAAVLLAAMLAVALVGAALARRLRFVVLTLVAIVAGMLASLLLYALAGYAVQGIGVFSRTTAVMSVWFCLFPPLVVAGASGRTVYFRAALALLLLPFVALLSVSTVRNTEAWITSWRFEQALLDSLPIEAFGHPKPGSVLLIDAQKPEGATEGLEAFWDTSGAIYMRREDVRMLFNPGRLRYFAVMADTGKKLSTWNGKELVQAWCHSPDTPLWTMPATGEAYVWSYPARTLVRLEPQARIGCPPKAQ